MTTSGILSRRAVLTGVGLIAWSGAARAQQLATFSKSKLVIETAKGKFPFDIELALTPPQMEQGLMFRRSLAADAGMLFDYGDPQPIAMWMKNTLIPLDMLFIDADGHVVHIAERAVPQSTMTISSEKPVRAVLELNGGTAARLGIEAGAVVRLPAAAAQN